MEYSLIYDKSVLLLPQSNSFNFSVSPATLAPKWKFKVTLSDDTSNEPLSTETSIDGDNNINIILYRWYSDNWVENVEPIEIVSKSSAIKLLVKIRLSMNQYQPNHKHIIVSVWKLG
jgi:hypothetical protein